MIVDPKLQTDRFTLRTWATSEAALLARLVADEAINRWTLIPPELTSQQAREWIDRRADRQVEGAGIALAIVPTGHGIPVGTVGIGRTPEPRRAEAYYWLGATSRGQGLASEAVSLLCGWAWSALCLERICVTVHSDNEASLRLVRRLGFQDAGISDLPPPQHPGASTAPLRRLYLDAPATT